jgi:nitrate/nitrite transport system ATP-binding protein
MPLLEVNRVQKAYSAKPVLRDISFTVEAGECVCIVGYSGSGKTTLVNLIAGLTTPDSGEVVFDGGPVAGPALDRSLIFQNYSLLPWLSALRNVELAVAQCMPGAGSLPITERALKYLRMVKLDHALDRRPAELSGGMRQRVALARGLAMEPKILLLDEPLGALDALTRAELQDEFVRIQQQEKRSMLMITNDVDEAIMLADRIIPLSAGPGATLGEPIAVEITRPCNRQQLNLDPTYQRVRKSVLNFLLANGPRETARNAGLQTGGLQNCGVADLETSVTNCAA